jgi:hypothetical protein
VKRMRNATMSLCTIVISRKIVLPKLAHSLRSRILFVGDPDRGYPVH